MGELAWLQARAPSLNGAGTGVRGDVVEGVDLRALLGCDEDLRGILSQLAELVQRDADTPRIPHISVRSSQNLDPNVFGTIGRGNTRSGLLRLAVRTVKAPRQFRIPRRSSSNPTVDEAHTIATRSLGARGLYVAMTRGANANHIHFAPPDTDEFDDSHGPGNHDVDEPWTARQAFVDLLNRGDQTNTAALTYRRQLRQQHVLELVTATPTPAAPGPQLR